MPIAIVIYMLHLQGGGGDTACAGCLPEAKRERADELLSVAVCDGEECMYCGVQVAA